MDYMLTTTDNPHDPFTDYDAWLAHDLLLGHDTNGLLARVVRTSEELSQPDQDVAVLFGMKEIVRYNISGVHTIVKRSAA